jgi:uncharacterized repeat protein (TIGR01451 family)
MSRLFRAAGNSVSRSQLVSPKLSQGCLSRPIVQFSLGLLSTTCLLSTIGRPAIANQIPTSGITWTGTNVTTGTGNAVPATKDTPSGLRMRVSVGGTGTGIFARNNTTLMTQGTILNPVLPAATNGLQLLTDMSNCPNGATVLTCSNLGTFSVEFLDTTNTPIKVRNPILHWSRLGGSKSLAVTTNGVTTNYSYLASVILQLTTPNLKFGSASGSSLAVSAGLNNDIRWAFPSTPPATAGVCATTTSSAGCGSTPIQDASSGNIFIDRLDFSVTGERTNASINWNETDTKTNLPTVTQDGYFITASFEEDFGDAPASFDTGGAASHIISDLAIGSAIDVDNINTTNGGATGTPLVASSPNVVAAGANNNGSSGDGVEEDGVTTWDPLTTTATTYSTTVALSGVSRAARVCGWVDFNRNNAFDNPTERACADVVVGQTSAVLNWTGLSGLTTGNNYARIRLSYDLTGVQNPKGALNSGEVEDYQIAITSAPAVVTFSCDSNIYMTKGSGGANGLYKVLISGSSVAFSPLIGTLNSGVNAIAFREADGYIYAMKTSNAHLIRIDANGGQTDLGAVTNLPAVYYNAGDFGPDGYYYVQSIAGGALEKIDIATRTRVSQGGTTTNNVSDFAIHRTDGFAYGVLNFGQAVRIPVAGGAGVPFGPIHNKVFGAVYSDVSGNVYLSENATNDIYQLDIVTGNITKVADFNPDLTTGSNDGAFCKSATFPAPPIDRSDAPISGTAPNGTGTNNYGEAVHAIVSGKRLGAAIDQDNGAIVDATASGDGADDDGISSFPTLTAGATSYSIPAANVSATGTGTLHAWIDFNQDGLFSATEYSSVSVTNGTLSGPLNWSGMVIGSSGQTFARLRFTSAALTDNTATTNTDERAVDFASDGEVEDYQVSIGAGFVNGTCQADGLVWVSGASGQIGHYRVSNQTFTTVANGTGKVWGDIAWASDNKLYGATFVSSPSLYEINPTTGASTLVASLTGVMRFPNAISGLPDASLLIGAASNAKVYRFDLTTPSNPPTIWHDFGAGDPSGDFILFNDKIYVAWRNAGTESLYEVTIDANYNYVSHRSLGALPTNSWGLALVLNKLYISANTTLYRINGIPTNPIASIPVTAVMQNTPYALYGATGIEEPFGGCTPMTPNLLLVKRITAINNGSNTIDGDSLSGYIDSLTNPYDDNVITIPTQATPADPAKDTTQWPTPNTFLIGGINGGNVKPADEMEYTIYFLSAGDAAAKNVLFCDRVPSNVTFLPTAFNGATPAPGGLAGDRGILSLLNGTTTAFTNIADGDAARYFAPGSDPTSIYPNIKCGGPNDNGAIVVNLGDLPNATVPGPPAGAFGFVRFKGRVK